MPLWAAIVEGEILHLYVYVVQMVFLKIYFCVFIMFLNNVSISAVRKNLPMYIFECDCLQQPGNHLPSSSLPYVFWGSDWLTHWERAKPRP